MELLGRTLCLAVLVALALPAGAGRAQESLEQRVKRLIHDLAIPVVNPGPYERTKGKQAQIFRELEGLGRPAVPYIIKYMDDRRRLPYRVLELSNEGIGGMGKYEAVRFYGPRQVVDGLAALLNQLTGKDFGDLYDGGTDTERTFTVAGWRAWCAGEYPDLQDICAGPSEPQQQLPEPSQPGLPSSNPK